MFRARTHLIVLVLTILTGLAASPALGAQVRVAQGETLSAIAARHGTTVAALAEANGIADPNRIRSGARLRVPGASVPARAPGRRAHTVRRGETLASIAARYGTSIARLARNNAIADPDLVRIGQVLQLARAPGADAAATPARVTARHRVRPGETLASIAARHRTTVAALVRVNRIADPNLIVAGRRLRVPRGDAGLPAPTSTDRRPSAAPVPATVSASEVRMLIDRHSARHGVDPALSRAIAWQESGFQQQVVSHTGAVGVMQLMPATARWIGSDLLGRRLDTRNVNDNIEGGVAFLKWLDARASGREEAIAAYYQGLSSVRARGLYDDTRSYVRSVVALTGKV